MEPNHFDRLTQALSLATTRRAAIGALLGGVLREVGAAHRRKRRQRRQEHRTESPAEARLTPLPPPPPGLPPPPPLIPPPPPQFCRRICPGCCTGQGVCQPGTSITACGAGGTTCVACANPTPICRSQTCAACTRHGECIAAGQGNLCCNGTCLSGGCCEDAVCYPFGDTCARHQCRCGSGPTCSGATPICFNGACTCHVCASGCPFSSVQDAIYAAQPGDTIRICAGVYNEGIVISRDLTLIGAGQGNDPAVDTILDATGTGDEAIYVTGGSTVALENLRITGGEVYRGGGLVNDATLTMSNCTVSGNGAATTGGGVINLGTLTMTDCTVSDNGTVSGAFGGIISGGNLTLTNCTIADNKAAYGGGLLQWQSTATLTNCTFSGNHANFGGGLYIGDMYHLENATVSLRACSVTGNTANGDGGGIYVIDSTLNLVGGAVSGNVTTGFGGGIYNGRSTTTLVASSVTGNIAGDSGGGIVNFGPSLSSSIIGLLSSSVTNNYAVYAGGGIFNGASVTCVSGSTVSGNMAGTVGTWNCFDEPDWGSGCGLCPS